MRKLITSATVFSTIALFAFTIFAPILRADCPTIYSIDDPSCTPCPPTYVDTYFGLQFFNDSSFWFVEGDWFKDCGGGDIYIPTYVIGYGGCPASGPCLARDLMPPPI